MGKQTEEHIKKRTRWGDEHWRWQGDFVSECGGRSRTLRRFKNLKQCELCESKKSERHHKDGNTANNSEQNIQFLCRRCHMKIDGRLELFADVGDRRGEKNGRAKLVPDDVREIRRLVQRGVSQVEVARSFGLTPTHISRIMQRKAWSHIE